MDKGKSPAVDEAYVPLHSLRPGARSVVKVMICRKWDVTNISGKYRSTEYILSDDQGSAIQCSARSNISHCFASKLEEGNVYSLRDFSVVPNKQKYRIRNTDACVIELEGYTVVKNLDCSTDAFIRFPFQLFPLDDIRLNDSTYLIDVMGYVVETCPVRTLNTGAELMDIHLMNERGTRIRVTLWGTLCNDFLNRPGHRELSYIVILPCLNIKNYNGEIYLSSTSATAVYDSLDIPQIAEFHAKMRECSTPATHCLPPPTVPRKVTVSELIRLGMEQKQTRCQTMALECKVRIASVRTKDSWFYNACGLGGCKKRVARIGTGFWCETCKKSSDFPRTSYRMDVVVEDGTGSVVLTLFDAAAEMLVKKKASTLAEQSIDDPDNTIIPQELLDLADSHHIFEIKTHTYFDKKACISFAVNRVITAYVATKLSVEHSKRARDEDDVQHEQPDSKLLRSTENDVDGVDATSSTAPSTAGQSEESETN